MPILGMGIARDYNRAPSLTKDVFWLEARPPAEDDPDLRLVGEWLLYVVPRKLDESWERVRKATIDSRLGFLSKSATAKKNYNMPSASNRMIVVYTSNYYDIDDTQKAMIRRDLVVKLAKLALPVKIEVLGCDLRPVPVEAPAAVESAPVV